MALSEKSRRRKALHAFSSQSYKSIRQLLGITLAHTLVDDGANRGGARGAAPEPVAEAGAAESAAAPRYDRRLWVIVTALVLMTLVILWRLFDYQLINRGPFTKEVLSTAPTPRGVIVDRDGTLLAADRIFYELAATPSEITTDEERMAVAQTLEMLIGLPATETFTRLHEAAGLTFVQLARTISTEQAEVIRTWRDNQPKNETDILQSVYFNLNPQRYYPQGMLASHVLGFVGIDAGRQAHYGLEEYYDPFLRRDGVGLMGNRHGTIDTLAPQLRAFVPSWVAKDLVLTIDRTVQWIIEDELRQSLDFYGAESGTIIVMEPHTGSVLGLANWPTYDPNDYSQANIEHFSNPAVSAQYEPGSIFKVITMAAALDTGEIEPYTIFTDTGSIAVGGRIILNSNRSAAGRITVSQALARSLNVVTAEVATQVGAEDFYRYVRRLGFGDATEIDLANEVPGLIKSPGTRDWSPSDLGTNSFGQGLAVTPIQMINSVAAIANGGKLMRPYVVQERVEGDSVLVTEPTVIRSVVSEETAAKLTDMMIEVVETGNQAALVPGYTVAGKSGTAQVPIEGGYSEDETIVSFVGFAPADDPQFVVLVKMDKPDPDISIWAAYSAAPTFSRVTARLLQHMNIPPDDVRLANTLDSQ